MILNSIDGTIYLGPFDPYERPEPTEFGWVANVMDAAPVWLPLYTWLGSRPPVKGERACLNLYDGMSDYPNDQYLTVEPMITTISSFKEKDYK